MANDERGYAHPELLRDTAWLEEHLNDPDLCLIDCESVDAYNRCHIPGARCLAAAIPGPTKRPPYLLKDPTDGVYIMKPDLFGEVMGRLGVGDDTMVYAYDGQGSHYAARLWWVLRYYGHSRVHLINGGWDKWMREGRRISRGPVHITPAHFMPRAQPQYVVTAEELRDSIGKPGVVILDTRTDAEYIGTNDRGTARGGHLPTAHHVEWLKAINWDEGQTFRPAAELREMYSAAGVTPDKEILTHCYGNIRSSHTAFTLTLLGYERVRNYEASWAEWGNRLDLPVER